MGGPIASATVHQEPCKDVVIGSVDGSGFVDAKKERASPLFSAEQPSAELVSARRIRLLGSFCQ
jgi:hypothetical protein